MKTQNHILKTLFICTLLFSACAPGMVVPEETQTPEPTETIEPSPIPRPEKNVALGKPVRVSAYSYRELSLFGMPFWAYADHGLVTYLETPIGYRAAGVTDRRRELIERITGRSYAGYALPLHRHVWGWLLVLGFLLWFFVRRWEEARWRQKTGLI